MAREEEAIRIYCRIRPSQDEQITFEYKTSPNNDDAEKSTKEHLQIFKPECDNNRLYEFNQVFQENATQEEVFEEVARPVLDRALEGYNGTIFAYGQTATGKTHTILGTVDKNLAEIDENTYEFHRLGLIPRMAIEIFNDIGDNVTIHISYMEIYNEIIYDLLNNKTVHGRITSDLNEVRLRYNKPNEAFYLPDLSKHKITDASQAMKILAQGNRNRHIAETKFNHASSRSHCILTFQFSVKQSELILNSKINLVDLAGSERVGKANETNSDRIHEANNINKSLLYLEMVMNALSKGKGHIPFRNSTLTKCLQGSLEGNSLNTMIATICNETRYVEETISTCRFSQDVADIKNVVVFNVSRDLNVVVQQLEEKLYNLEKDNEQKVNEITKMNQLNNSLSREISALRSKEPKLDRKMPKDVIEKTVNDYLEGVIEQLEIGNNFDNVKTCYRILKGIILRERERAAAREGELRKIIEQKENISTKDEEQQTETIDNNSRQKSGSVKNRHIDNELTGSSTLPDKTKVELDLLVKNFIFNSIEIDVRMDVHKIRYCFESLRDEIMKEKVERVKDEAVVVGKLRNKVEELEEILKNVNSLPNVSFSTEDMYDVREKLQEYRLESQNNLNKEDDVIQSYIDMVKEKIVQGKHTDSNYVEEIRILKDEITDLKNRLKESEENALPAKGNKQLSDNDEKKMEAMIIQFINGDIDFLNVGQNQAKILFCFNQLRQHILLKQQSVTKTVYVTKRVKSGICVIL